MDDDLPVLSVEERSERFEHEDIEPLFCFCASAALSSFMTLL